MSDPKPSRLSLVIPCFNESEVLPEAAERLKAKLRTLIDSGKIASNSAIYFVDDGSRDGTWGIIEKFSQIDDLIHGIKLSGNCGHQNALLAGLMTAPGDILISMDADLQDDIDAIDPMIDDYYAGSEIVFGVRSARNLDSPLKKYTAEGYYRLMEKMGVRLIFNHADYRLMSRAALKALAEFNEVNLFLRGIVPMLGFTTSVVHYSRGERFAGDSKYPMRKMLSFAWNGITSFSNVPLRLITSMGILTSFVSLLMLVWVMLVKFVFDDAIPGWASITLPLLFLGGVQLLSVGVIGEYVAKIYLETKARPRYIVEKQV